MPSFFDRLPFRRELALPIKGTFLAPQDHSGSNQQAWLDLVAALVAKDVPGVVEHLPRAHGTLDLLTRTGTLRRGALPRAVHALLADGPAFLDERRVQKERRAADRPSGSRPTGSASPDRTPWWVSAAELVAWYAPDLVAPVVRAGAVRDRALPDGAWPVRPALDLWFTGQAQGLRPITALRLNAPDGTVDRRHGSPSAVPHEAAIATALTMAALDQLGRDRFRDVQDRRRGAYVSGPQDSPALAWLQASLREPVTGDDRRELQRRQRVFRKGREGDAATDAPVLRAWDRALAEVPGAAQEQGWDVHAWSDWARRWMLACDAVHFPEGVVSTASTFWAHCPQARLPLHPGDSIAPTTVLGQPGVFTDDRLADWLLTPLTRADDDAPALGTVQDARGVQRPARNVYTDWQLAEGFVDRVERQPWTWLEWSVEQGRLDLAQRLAGRGWCLPAGFEASFLTRPEWLPKAQTVAWPYRLVARTHAVERIRLAEEIHRATPDLAQRDHPRRRL